MMLDGKPRAVDAAEVKGFVDEVVGDDLGVAAVAFARRIVSAESAPRRTANRPLPEAVPEVFERHEVAARKRRGEPAPERIVAAVRRAIDMPFADAVARARADFLALRDTPESKALRHAFFAERESAKLPAGVMVAAPRALRSAAVIGAGTMGQGIAIALLDAGFEVTLVETAAAALARAEQRLAAHYEAAAAKGRITAAAVPGILSRLGAATGIEAIGAADVVIEAVFEDLGVKREVFAQIDVLARPDALLATNTSYLDVAEIAAFTRRPQEVIGLHFFSPANVMRLVEIVRTDASSPEALGTGIALVKRLKKVGILCKGRDGFVGNRMLVLRTRECLFMLEEGALPQQIDAALVDFGFAMGPLAVGDLAAGTTGGGDVTQILAPSGITAAELIGSVSGSAILATLAGGQIVSRPINSIAALGSFTVSGSSGFVLDAFGALDASGKPGPSTVNGPLTAKTGPLTISKPNGLAVTGTITANGAVDLTDDGGGTTITGNVKAPTIALSSGVDGHVALSGNSSIGQSGATVIFQHCPIRNPGSDQRDHRRNAAGH